jgi:hypothetical protein
MIFDMKMVTQDVENGWCDQTFWILLAVSAVLSVLMVVTILDDVPLSILVLLGFVSLTTYPFLYIVYRWYACVWSQVTLVHKYSKRFSPQGVFVEHRRIVSFHPWLGPYERHYVDMYVAPPPPPSCGSEWTLVNDTDTDKN